MGAPSLDDIHYMLGQMDGKLTILVAQGTVQDDRHSALDSRVRSLEQAKPDDEAHKSFESRLRTVEQRQHWYAGASAAVASLGTYLFGHIGSLKP